MSEQEQVQVQVPSNVESPVSFAVNSGSETTGINVANYALNTVFSFSKN